MYNMHLYISLADARGDHLAGDAAQLNGYLVLQGNINSYH